MTAQTPATAEIKSDSGTGPVFHKFLTPVPNPGSEKTQNSSGVDSGNPDPVPPLLRIS